MPDAQIDLDRLWTITLRDLKKRVFIVVVQEFAEIPQNQPIDLLKKAHLSQLRKIAFDPFLLA